MPFLLRSGGSLGSGAEGVGEGDYVDVPEYYPKP